MFRVMQRGDDAAEALEAAGWLASDHGAINDFPGVPRRVAARSG